MTKQDSREMGPAIMEKAREWGADLVGIAGIADLKRSPSHQISAKIPEFDGVGTIKMDGRKRGVVTWPDGYKSAIVIAVAHPVNEPEMDWWVAGNTSGNHRLIRIASELAAWLESETGIQSSKLPYHIEHGGVFLKDAAVLAGLGCIGRNNMLLTPAHGPRVRLRALLTDADLPSATASTFDPCDACSAPCLGACPQNAFEQQVHSPAACGQTELPGRTGFYDRLACDREMKINEAGFEEVRVANHEEAVRRVKYCRACELACPA